METNPDLNCAVGDGSGSSSLNRDGSSRDEGDRSVLRRAGPKFNPTALEYDMTGNRLMFIFNHSSWSSSAIGFSTTPSPRQGSERDETRLRESFGNIEFRVEESCKNFTHDEIVTKLEDICNMDHSNTSCIAIVVLTHGCEGSKVYAADKPYELNDIFIYLQNEIKLAGIPKLFFIQACRGDKLDSGHRIQVDGDTRRSALRISTHSDCLVLMSTYDGHVSFRKSSGSWMIQSLCDVIDEFVAGHHQDRDLTYLMTLVHHKITMKISNSTTNSDYHDKLQTPETRFTLTKFLKF